MDIATAIESRSEIAFVYDGLRRVVQPATLGITSTGNTAMRGCLIAGSSKRNTIPCWELYSLSKIMGATETGHTFSDFTLAGYTRGDSGFVQIIAEH
jgi:hypothetical protein